MGDPVPVFLPRSSRTEVPGGAPAHGVAGIETAEHIHIPRYSKASSDSVISQNQMRLYAEKCFANSKVCINIKRIFKRESSGVAIAKSMPLGLKVQKHPPAP